MTSGVVILTPVAFNINEAAKKVLIMAKEAVRILDQVLSRDRLG